MEVGARSSRPALSAEQSAALEAVVAAMDGRPAASTCCTGSRAPGKTEVYLAATEAALERGKGAIVLVPEIGLTPQAISRFAARFGDRVALLHSRLAAGERRDEWERLHSGEARICVGPRSAVFAPVRDLGLVVIDEEHDASYKQEGDPRYDAREVARHRAREAGAALLAGSATPRPESWLGLPRLELPRRADGRELPPVEVVDLRGGSPRWGPLHPRTMEALAEVREANAKAIVLLNRRGWSPFVSCRACGHAFECPHCDVSLVLHKRERAPSVSPLRPRRAGPRTPAPRAARLPSLATAPAPSGWPPCSTRRWRPFPCSDSTPTAPRARAATLEILRRFEQAESGVLVGTQMVAKGHDFPDVVLSVVLDADATLRFPDFRAEERTFALVAQLAGRSGRGERGGRVLVQTLAPEAAAIRHAAAHDAQGFLAGELERRRALRYPPFSHLIRIELTSPEAGRAQAAAERVRRGAGGRAARGHRAPGPAPRFRLRGRHRRQLLLKAEHRAEAVAAVRDAVEGLAAGRELRGVSVSVDVDPQ